jgi:ATP-dependent Clp protease ATP-binding subunit ClpA
MIRWVKQENPMTDTVKIQEYYSALMSEAFSSAIELAKTREEPVTIIHLLNVLVDINSGDWACLLQHFSINHQAFALAVHDLLLSDKSERYFHVTLEETKKRLFRVAEHYPGKVIRSIAVIDVLFSLPGIKEDLSLMYCISLQELHQDFIDVVSDSQENLEAVDVEETEGSDVEVEDYRFWKERREIRLLYSILGHPTSSCALLVSDEEELPEHFLNVFRKSLYEDENFLLSEKQLKPLDVVQLAKEIQGYNDDEQYLGRQLSSKDIYVLPNIHRWLVCADRGGVQTFLDSLGRLVSEGKIKLIATVSHGGFETYRAWLSGFSKEVPIKITKEEKQRLFFSLQRQIEKDYSVIVQSDVMAVMYDQLTRFFSAAQFFSKARDVLRAAAARVVNLASEEQPAMITISVVKKIIADSRGVSSGDVYAVHQFPFEVFEERFLSQIMGQSHLSAFLMKYIHMSMINFSLGGVKIKPLLFCGEKGVGKTAVAKLLAESYGGGAQSFLSLGSCEINSASGLDELKTVPNQQDFCRPFLLDELAMHPSAIVFIPKVDECLESFLMLFQSVLSEGFTRGSDGRVIDCRQVLFILTTEVGKETISDVKVDTDEFETEDDDFMNLITARSQNQEDLSKNVNRSKLAETVMPALRSALSDYLLKESVVVPFMSLEYISLKKLLEMKLAQFDARLKEKYGLQLRCAVGVEAYLLEAVVREGGNAGAVETVMSELLMVSIAHLLVPVVGEDTIIMCQLPESGDWLYALRVSDVTWQASMTEEPEFQIVE